MLTAQLRYFQQQKVSTHFYSCPVNHLTYWLGHLPGVITHQVIETAKNRAHVLRDTRKCKFFLLYLTILIYWTADAAQQFLNPQLPPAVNAALQQLGQQMNVSHAQLEAWLVNLGIRSRNRRHLGDPLQPLQPLQKYVCFSAFSAIDMLI